MTQRDYDNAGTIKQLICVKGYASRLYRYVPVRSFQNHQMSERFALIGEKKVTDMKGVKLVMRRFGAHEFRVRQLCRSDPEIREACEMLAITVAALERWKADEKKAEEYRQIIEDLEAEILNSIERER